MKTQTNKTNNPKEEVVRTTEEYISAWQSHVRSLDRLRWNLNQSQMQELDNLQVQLIDLIVVAAENLATARLKKEVQ